MVKSRYIGDGHLTFNRNPFNGYINPYYWVDDHPLLYGNNGSLDPSTFEGSKRIGNLKMAPFEGSKISIIFLGDAGILKNRTFHWWLMDPFAKTRIEVDQ